MLKVFKVFCYCLNMDEGAITPPPAPYNQQQQQPNATVAQLTGSREPKHKNF